MVLIIVCDRKVTIRERLLLTSEGGSWLSCRAQLRNILKQEPLEEHPKQRGAIVNIASQLGIVGRPGAGKSHARVH